MVETWGFHSPISMKRASIKARDIKDFEKAAQRLNTILQRIRKYNPEANVFSDGDTLNLLSGYDDESRPSEERDAIVVSCVTITSLDSGDW